jgi:para-nitrobenzyl esterase
MGEHMKFTSRSAACFGLVAAAIFVGAACNPLAPPAGPPPLRYRDPVFTAVTKTADITYGSAVNQTNQTVALKLDLYQPAGDPITARPAIVWVHGGSFSSGSKTSGELVDQANEFAKKGYVNVSIDYRLSPVNCLVTPGAQCLIAAIQARQDALTAVRFLREQAATYSVDPKRIAIGGTSAGAITALGVGYTSETSAPGDHQGFSAAVGAVQSLSGAQFNTSLINKGDAPALLFHGTADPLVPYAAAQATVTAATNAGVVAILRSWAGEGHVPYAANRTQILEETSNFFYNLLDLAQAAR